MERVFDVEQRLTLEAAVDRVIPPDADPGAREAGVADFIEGYLSGIATVYARPGGGFHELAGPRAEAWRRRIQTLRATYLQGLRELDARARSRFGMSFHELSPDRQDHVLASLEEELPSEQSATVVMQLPTWEEGLSFFRLLVLHTRQGFYGDPVYGGNRDGVGWRVVGFPGTGSGPNDRRDGEPT
jgi:gluconate 2-dehydrogenase gamma chain